MKLLRCCRLSKRRFQATILTVKLFINLSLSSYKRKTLKQFLIPTMFWEVRSFQRVICTMLSKWLVLRMQNNWCKNVMRSLLRTILSTKSHSFSCLKLNIGDKDFKIENNFSSPKKLQIRHTIKLNVIGLSNILMIILYVKLIH